MRYSLKRAGDVVKEMQHAAARQWNGGESVPEMHVPFRDPKRPCNIIGHTSRRRRVKVSGRSSHHQHAP